MKQVVWSKRAQRDLEGLNGWYEAISADLPLALTLRVEAAAATLLDFPQIGSLVPDSTVRKWGVPKTPYLFFYRPTANGIRILKVHHVRSDWKPRA